MKTFTKTKVTKQSLSVQCPISMPKTEDFGIMHTCFKAFFQLAYELIKIIKWFLSGSKSLTRVYAEGGKITTPSIQHAIKEKQKAFKETFLTLTSRYEQKCTDKLSFI